MEPVIKEVYPIICCDTMGHDVAVEFWQDKDDNSSTLILEIKKGESGLWYTYSFGIFQSDFYDTAKQAYKATVKILRGMGYKVFIKQW